MMGPYAELLASGHRQTLEFFVTGLRDVTEQPVDPGELYYNASVLAHYAQTSTATTEGFPTPTSLASVFDQFVLTAAEWGEHSAVMESAATQCLILAGFFEDQSKRRHSIQWYSQLGAGFFARAARGEGSSPKAALLMALSEQFEPWRQRHARLSRELRDQRLLIRHPKAS
jgi:hypothetical protein